MSLEKPLYLKALEALRRREGLFRILIFSLVTVLFWIGFSIFFSQQKTKVSVDILKFTTPLNPNINRAILEDAAKRTSYTDQELQNFPLYDRITTEKTGSQLIIAGSDEESTDIEDVLLSSASGELDLETDQITEPTGDSTVSATPTLTEQAAQTASASTTTP